MGCGVGQAAVQEGIVPGGGAALLYASKLLDAVKEKCANFDQKVGVSIVQKACAAPLRTIAQNAGDTSPRSVPVGPLSPCLPATEALFQEMRKCQFYRFHSLSSLHSSFSLSSPPGIPPSPLRTIAQKAGATPLR